MKWRFLAIVVLLCGIVFGDAPDFRPKFDKSDVKGKVYIQVNPWFPMNKAPIHALGGPNTAWLHHVGENLWGQGMKLCDEYGVDGWDVETSEPGPSWIMTYKRMLDEAEAVGAKLKLGIFLGCTSKTPEEAVVGLRKVFEPIKEDLKSNPHVARIGGRPRIVVYTPFKYKPEGWKIIMDALEAEFGPMVWLMCRPSALKSNYEERLRQYLPYFDGVGNYGSNGLEDLRKHAEISPRVWKDYPQKQNEGPIHSTYTCHFHMGGLPVPLSKAYRETFDLALSTNPDTLQLTNLFDHYENSLVYPCYEREDFMLRYMEYRVSQWQVREFRAMEEPELVLTNYCMLYMGKATLDFEVMGFPIASDKKEVSVRLELCSTSGEVLRSFPARKMTLDKFCVEYYSLPSLDFHAERGIVPRLVYTWNGKTYKTPHNPMTLLSPSIRPYRMYWARSTKNALLHKGEEDWTLGGVHPGQTFVPSEDGLANFNSHVLPDWGKGDRRGISRVGIRRDCLEWYFTTGERTYLKQNFVKTLPPGGQALHWYHLEIENRRGRRWQSLPIWTADGSRAANVMIPFVKSDGTVADYPIEGARVPFWYFPCQVDAGKILMDVSGYEHHGYINGSGYGGGHLGYMGYNYYHNGPMSDTKSDAPSKYGRDDDGTCYLRFGGDDYVMIMGGSAMPGAATYELCVRPVALGERLGLMGSGNNQMTIEMLEDGTVTATRRTANEGAGGEAAKVRVEDEIRSSSKLQAGKWTRVAVTYDLRKIRLYINGKQEAEKESIPNSEHEWMNLIVLGAANKWVWEPVRRFKGDIRDFRVYGRNLQPSEFLGAEGVASFKPVANPYIKPMMKETLLDCASGKAEQFKDLSDKDGRLLLEKQASIMSKDQFEVDPEATYIFSAKLENGGDKPYSVYVGANISGLNAFMVYFTAGSESSLTAAAKKGDKVLRVADASSWAEKGFVALNVDGSGYCADLPNKNLIPLAAPPQKTDDGKWELKLVRSLPFDMAENSFVRQHVEGPTFNWAGATYLMPGKQVEFSAKLKGVAVGGTEGGKFWPGAKNFKFVIAPMFGLSPEKPLIIHSIKLEKQSVKK